MDVWGWAARGVAFGTAHGSELPAEMCCLEKVQIPEGMPSFCTCQRDKHLCAEQQIASKEREGRKHITAPRRAQS